MYFSKNRIEVTGNLTKDPELKYTPNGSAVANFSVATSRSWLNQGGDRTEETQFHRVVAWGKQAEHVVKWLFKGTKVELVGRMTYREYTDRNGQKRNVAEIVLEDFMPLTQNQGQGQTNRTSAPAGNSQNRAQQNRQTNQQWDQIQDEYGAEPTDPADNLEDVDPNDIPF